MNKAEQTSEREVLLVHLAETDDERLGLLANEFHPADLADVLEGLEDEESRLRLFRVLAPEMAADTIRELGEQPRAELAFRLTDARLASILERLDSDDAADLLGDLPASRRHALLQRARPETRRDVEELLTYPQDSAGGRMKTELATVSAGTSVRGTTEYLRRNSDVFHDVHNVFITDAQDRLIGLVSLRTLLLADDSLPVSLIMDTTTHAAVVSEDQETVARRFEKYDLLSIPVTDDLDRLVGRITVDDIVDVVVEEATEDMLKMAGVGDEPLAPVGPLQAMRSRLPWLTLNMLTATISAAVITSFETTIHEITLAAGLMTIVAAQGGNAGAQTMTLVVRGLAVGDVQTSQIWRLLWSECLTGLGNGTVLGTLAGLIAYVWRGNLGLSIVLASSILAVFVIAAIVGSLVPLGLKRLRIDPAVSSSVLVITTVDVMAFFIFLGLLTLVM